MVGDRDEVGDSDPTISRGDSLARLRIGLLGPTLVSVDGLDRPLSAGRQRAVLACLATRPGEAVSADRLLDEVWGDDLPETGASAVAYQISKLRELLEPAHEGSGTLIVTCPAGYVLDVERDHVDVHRFDRLIDEARDRLSTDPARARALIEEGLGLWRGRAFADLGAEPFVDRETRRLDQRQLLALRTRAEVYIALGRYADVVGDLETMVDEHPLEESAVQMLMVALHGSGRTADALRAFGEFRVRLGMELGIEPSHDLQALEQQLLMGAPDWDLVLEPADPPRRSAVPQLGKVPVSLSSFVGRSEELAQIAELLRSARVVTLCGFGGLGKTRLAREIATTGGPTFEDGVWFVDLTPVTDPSVLADTLITAGNESAVPDVDPLDHLLALLAGRDALVVLDNCEHLVAAVAELVARIVRAAPRVRVLATSRVSLGLADEAIYTVHPLDAHAAVELFVDRARLVRTGFVVDKTNRADVEALCERLDRIPLAIEMATARLSVMSVPQITEHLDDRFQLLTTSRRVATAEKQHSLIAVMDWSYGLLDEADQVLLRRLSVCAGGFTLEAATEFGMPDTVEASLTNVLDRLSHLVEASLVDFDVNHHPRYRMLETVREYAAAQLEPGERDDVALAHAVHYDAVASTMHDLADENRHEAMQLGRQELGNIRAAMSWAYDNGHPRLGLSIARYTRFYFNAHMMHRETFRWLQTGLEVLDDDADTLEAAAAVVIEAFNVDEPEAQRLAAARVKNGLGTVDDPSVKADLLAAFGTYLLDTDPMAGDAYLAEALRMRASSLRRTLVMLNNRIEGLWEAGRLGDPEEPCNGSARSPKRRPIGIR